MKLTKKCAALAIVVLLYTLFLIWWMQASPIDSDYSNLVLEANEIIRGNVFLSDWNLTGISFITTDLLFFEVGSVFGGISALTYYIAGGLMISALMLLGFLLCEPKKRTPPEGAAYFLLCSVPCAWALFGLRAHTGTVCWAFLTIWFISRERETHQNKNLILAGIFTVMGCLGDSLCLLIGILPIVLICAVDVISETKTQDARSNLRILETLACAVICSLVLDRLYFHIGGANKNQFLGAISFEPVENWWNKLALYLKCLFMVMDADFFGRQLVNIRTLGYSVNTLIIFLGFQAMGRSILRFFTRRMEADFISTALSLGILIVSLLFILTSAGVDVYSCRYIAYILCAFSVLIIRNLKGMGTRFGLKQRWFLALVLLLSLISFLFRIESVAGFSKQEHKQERLGAFLAERRLEEGYASFWNASSTTVLSENRVKVRAIIASQNQDGLKMYRWFCKNAWYTERSNFVIAAQNDMYGITPECVTGALGEPEETLTFEDLTVLVYDRDLSKDLANGISDGILEPFELNAYGNIELTPERGYTLYPGAILYGPYDPIGAGEYTLTYTGDNLDQIYVDVYSNSAGFFGMDTVSESEDRLVCRVTIPNPISDIEFRVHNLSQEPIVFDQLTIEKTG